MLIGRGDDYGLGAHAGLHHRDSGPDTAFAERRVASVKGDWLSKSILFGETSSRRALREYLVHYHAERNHQWNLLHGHRPPLTGIKVP